MPSKNTRLTEMETELKLKRRISGVDPQNIERESRYLSRLIAAFAYFDNRRHHI